MKRYNLSNVFKIKSESVRHKLLNKYTINKYDKRAFLNNVEKLEEQAESGGLVEKDCNFYDYDGTLLYSYTAEEALALTELPPLPTQPGLICQEWNYSLEDIIENNGVCDVGATYITDDGKTRFYISITNKNYLTVSIIVGATSISGQVIGEVEIDWGDGTTTTTKSTAIELSHTYVTLGNYIISIYNANGNYKLGGPYVGNTAIVGTKLAGYVNMQYKNMLYRVEFGHNVNLSGNSYFTNCANLKYITISNTTILTANYTFHDTGLKYVVVPKSATSINNMFNQTMLEGISIPNKCVVGSNTFDNTMIKKIVLPKHTSGKVTTFTLYNLKKLIINGTDISSLTVQYKCLEELRFDVNSNIKTLTIYDNLCIKELRVPNECTSISIRNCYLLDIVYMSKTIMELDDYFCHNSSARFIFFTDHESVPTLSSKNSFEGSSIFKVVVPDTLYDEWIAATNWSNYTSRIIKQSEYEANQQ